MRTYVINIILGNRGLSKFNIDRVNFEKNIRNYKFIAKFKRYYSMIIVSKQATITSTKYFLKTETFPARTQEKPINITTVITYYLRVCND